VDLYLHSLYVYMVQCINTGPNLALKCTLLQTIFLIPNYIHYLFLIVPNFYVHHITEVQNICGVMEERVKSLNITF
jgi:hypothetical protein